jgi:predicted metal-binding protein
MASTLNASTGGMDIDEDHSQNSQSPLCYNQPNYGTKRYEKTHEPVLPSPKTLDELFQEYKQFSLLKKKDDMSSNQEAGTEAYLLSRHWLKNYLNFILFDDFRRELTAEQIKIAPNHFTEMHPGHITN